MQLIIDGSVSANVLGLLVVGCTVGFLSGLFGIGGGALITPILQIFFGIPFEICVGSILAQAIGTSFSAALRHWQLGNVDLKLAITFGGGSIIGVEIGARILDHLKLMGQMEIGKQQIPVIEFYPKWLFFILLMVVAIGILIESTREQENDNPPNGFLRSFHVPPYITFPTSGIKQISIFAATYPALLIGIIPGLLGIGGGVIILPLLIYGYGIRTRMAIGTSLFIVFFSVLFGTVVHGIRGNSNLALIAILLVGSTISAQFGAIATQKINASSIRFYFAFVVLAVDGIILVDLLRQIF